MRRFAALWQQRRAALADSRKPTAMLTGLSARDEREKADGGKHFCDSKSLLVRSFERASAKKKVLTISFLEIVRFFSFFFFSFFVFDF